MTNHPPALHGLACPTVDRASARDVRRVWCRFLPRTLTFRHPAAVELAEWADALLHLETHAAWCAAHPDAGDLPTEAER